VDVAKLVNSTFADFVKLVVDSRNSSFNLLNSELKLWLDLPLPTLL